MTTSSIISNANWTGFFDHRSLGANPKARQSPTSPLICLAVESSECPRVSASPPSGGTISADPLPGTDGKYAAGAVVTLTAHAEAGYDFSNWGGALSGSANPTTITMDADKSVAAIFSQPPRYALTLSASPTAGGTISADPLPGTDGKYAAGAVVTLTAHAEAGYDFSNWGGALSGSANPTAITMDADKSVAAIFSQPPRYALTLSASPTAGGTVSADPLPGTDGKYAAGAVVTLTAHPAAGYSFSSWSGALSGSANPATVTMSGNKSVTAVFSQIPPEARYSLTLSASPTAGGTILPTRCLELMASTHQGLSLH